MNTANEIASWFINKSIEDSVAGGEYMTHLKVQKLLYYSQGFGKIFNNEKIFDEKIVAWQYGPVVESVFHNLKKFGSNGISERIENVVTISENVENVLNLVYNKLGQFSAFKLVELTHSEDPWKKTKAKEEIKLELIEDYFRRVYVNS